jgi:hypothetical protein
MFLYRRPSISHNRTPSVISTSADQEICAVAELMSRSVVEGRNYFAEEQEQLGAAPDDELDEFVEPSIHHELESAARAKKVIWYTDSEMSPYRPHSPSRSSMYPPSSPSRSSIYPPPSPSRNSTYSDSDQTSDSELMYLPKTTAYPAFHLPRPRPWPVGIRDSDTPSLSSSTSFSSLGSVSRSHSRRNSPPTSPAALVTPIEHQPATYPHLAIIEERNFEDQDIPYRLSMESTTGSITAITFADPEPPSSKTEDIQRDVPAFRKRMPHLEHLKLNTMSPRRSRSQSPSLQSPSRSSDSGSLSPLPLPTPPATKHRAGSAVSFTRFIGSGSKRDKEKEQWSASVQSASASLSSFETTGLSKGEIKQRKAEEKLRKKADAKAKTERLAFELKEKARQRALAQEKAVSLHSSRSGDKPVWADGPSMFGGLGTL